MSASPRAGCLPRIGGALALDFCNSTTGRGTAQFVEHLFDHEDLLRWCVFNGILTPAAASALAASCPPAAQAETFARAMAARVLLNRIFDAVAHGAPAAAVDLDELSRLARGLSSDAVLRPTGGGGYAWRYAPADARAGALLGPIARSAVEILTTCDLSRLKACPGEGCGWVFLDATKNGGRVWCEMEVCGTRAKLRNRTAARRARRGG